MTGLGASLITFVPNETAKSGDVNSNLSNLNNAANPSFSTLGVTGASSLDNGAITTNGAGTLNAGTVSAGTLNAGSQITGAGIQIDIEGGITVIRSEPTSDPMFIQINGHNFQLNTDGSITVHGAINVDNGALSTDGGGNLTGNVIHSSSPIVLRAGNQETGMTGADLYVGGSGVGLGMGQNYKTYTTNTPSSISTTGINVVGMSGLAILTITTYGFVLHWTSTGSGNSEWVGSYTTVGNCLLRVSDRAQTFDHHCDLCEAEHRDVPISALEYLCRPGKYHLLRNHLTREVHHFDTRVALNYTCPDCGTIEHFDTRMTALDEDDASPQGSGAYLTTRGAQAAMIRQLLKLLALPVA